MSLIFVMKGSYNLARQLNNRDFDSVENTENLLNATSGVPGYSKVTRSFKSTRNFSKLKWII